MNYRYKKIRWLLLLWAIVICASSYAQGIRKHYEEMTDTERSALVAAYFSLGGPNGTTGLVSEIADFHEDHFTLGTCGCPDPIHFNTASLDVFLAWHRQASHELERAMRADANNEWLSMAYWDWTLSNSKSDALWGNNWLGPFNPASAWDLNRLSSSSQSLPTQSDIDVALMNSNFFSFSRFSVEANPIHSRGHTWTGGTMADGDSPRDPVFFFHHNMVDKIWAEWYEIHGVAGTDYYIKTDMPRYDGTHVPAGSSSTLPSIDPDDLSDPRSLGIFYAEAGLAVLDKYSVTNTFTSSEKYGYQFKIEAKDDFIVPAGRNAEFRSCNEIEFLPGFEARYNSKFEAKIDVDCNFTTAPLIAGNDGPVELNEDPKSKASVFSDGTTLRSFPNPFKDQATIEYSLAEDTEITIEILNVTGQQVKSLLVNELQTKGMHSLNFDSSELPNGIYYCSLSSGFEDAQTIKMVLSR